MRPANKLMGVAAGIALLSATANTNALTINATGNNPGFGQAASATLSLSGGVLTIDLVNTGTIAANNPQVLTGLFFSLPGGTTLTTGSATLFNGSTFKNGTGTNPGNGWVYAGGISVQGQNAGISAAGLGVFGNTGYFGPSPVTPLDGVDYGIINGIAAVQHLNPGPQISNGIEFTLNVHGALNLNTFANTLVFQWGTALDEGSGGPGLPPQGGLPDGGTTALLLGSALTGVGLLRRKMG